MAIPTYESLSISKVKEAVYSYEEHAVTDQLFAFGCVLLGEIQDRAKQLDEKAVMILGWSLAILVFLFTQAEKIRGGLAISLAVTGGSLALQCLEPLVFHAMTAAKIYAL